MPSDPLQINGFFHDREFHEVVTSSEKRIYIYGARATGKTTVFKRLVEHFENTEQDRQLLLLEGASWDAALKKIHDAVSPESNNPLLQNTILMIDDLDLLFRYGASSRKTEFDDFLNDFTSLISSIFNENGTVISFSAQPADEMSDEFPSMLFSNEKNRNLAINFFSDVFRDWYSIVLLIWPYGWWDYYSQGLESLDLSGPLHLKDFLLDLTGVHPALLQSAVDLLMEIRDKKGRDWWKDLGETGQQTFLQYLEDTVAHRCMRVVRKIVQDVKESKTPANQEAFVELIDFVATRDAGAIPANARFMLIEKGLLRPDEDGTYSLPGKLFEAEIVRFVKSKPVDRKYNIDKISNKKGVLLVSEGAKSERFVFSGKSWVLLQYLFNHRERIVSLQDITQDMGMGSENTARSTLQRLDQKLRELGIAILENKRGGGLLLEYILKTTVR